MTTWLEFTEYPNEGRKTRIWRVVGRGQGRPPLGWVRWFGRWRQYVFFPDAETVYNHGCLSVLAAFCDEQTRTHRALRAADHTERNDER